MPCGKRCAKLEAKSTFLAFSAISHYGIRPFSNLSSTNQCHKTQSSKPVTVSTYLQPQQQYLAPTVHPYNSRDQAPGAADTVGMDYHQCRPGMAEALGGEQSVSAHPEHGG
jgi:hypothetical protein